jgi:hypothetical protein
MKPPSSEASPLGLSNRDYGVIESGELEIHNEMKNISVLYPKGKAR